MRGDCEDERAELDEEGASAGSDRILFRSVCDVCAEDEVFFFAADAREREEDEVDGGFSSCGRPVGLC